MLVALTRERGHNDELRQWLGERAEAVEIPLTVTKYRPLREVEEEIVALEGCGMFRSLVVTSARCEDYLSTARRALSADSDVFSVGPATSAALQRMGLAAKVEGSGSSLDLCDDIVRGPVLVLAAEKGRRELSDALSQRSLDVSRVECYRTREIELSHDEAQQLSLAQVVFIGAPSAWRVASTYVTPDAWVLVPGHTSLEAVRRDHARVLVGWGEDFNDAWRNIQAATS